MKICDYGCNNIAVYEFKNGKWCCSINVNKCPIIRKKKSDSLKGRKNPEHSKRMKGRKNPEHSKRMSGKNNPNYGKKRSRIIIEKIRNGNKGKKRQTETIEKMKGINNHRFLTIKKIKEQYPFFSKIEQMRYNPDKPGEKEIQIHCKNNLCKNSKENRGWFTPSRIQLQERIRALEKPHGMIENNFYCSDGCKTNCKLYNLKIDPYKNTENHYIPGYEIFRQEVLRRQLEEYGYNFCEYCNSEENLHVHHEKPQKTNPLFILDPDNGICCCDECHYKHGHKTGSECSIDSLAHKTCREIRNGRR